MTKEELKNYIKKLGLEKELEELIFELIDGAKEVNKVLLNTIADILDQQANFYEKTADIYDELANEYENLYTELSLLNEEEYKERLEAFQQAQEELLGEINKKIEEIKLNKNQEIKTQDESEIEKLKQTLQQQATT